ncbi:hypothetical protein PAPYR_5099 [Paratrimastix pyriformis]|uniref:Uncharacterized protein n=1 Tax=Paratrimastix pyriformis TaxID=342808 RepID=A0ABQ8UMW4_9EUKA|nr:hypothetical protein PAPYR_5099 [Paratrimastix pyriformis]
MIPNFSRKMINGSYSEVHGGIGLMCRALSSPCFSAYSGAAFFSLRRVRSILIGRPRPTRLSSHTRHSFSSLLSCSVAVLGYIEGGWWVLLLSNKLARNLAESGIPARADTEHLLRRIVGPVNPSGIPLGNYLTFFLRAVLSCRGPMVSFAKEVVTQGEGLAAKGPTLRLALLVHALPLSCVGAFVLLMAVHFVMMLPFCLALLAWTVVLMVRVLSPLVVVS